MDEDRLERLESEVDSMRGALGDISEILSSLQNSVNAVDDIARAENAHNETTGHLDAREELDVGDTYRVVVETPPGERGPDAVARIDGLVVFVKPDEYELTAGTFIEIRLVDIGRRQAHAVVLSVIEEGVGG